MTQDQRYSAIEKWLSAYFDHDQFQLSPASSDASFRRYFRVTTDDDSWIVMDAPPEKEDTAPFIHIARFLGAHHINVPRILAQDQTQGFLLLTDFGSTPYLTELNSDTVGPLYRDAIDALIAIQSCPPNNASLPTYDARLLRSEMQLFEDWFLTEHFGIAAPSCLAHVLDVLIDNAIAQPQSIVHRDYHSRNLMITPQHNPGIIDFQDAVIGPISYDVVSLLRDSYIAWPETQITDCLSYYLTQAKQQNLIDNAIDSVQFRRWFDLMGMQRQLKILGIFCRLYYRDNKPNYMADLAQTMTYLKTVSAQYDEFADFHTFLHTHPQLMTL